MNTRLLSLTFAPFALGSSAFVYVGLITPMAKDLGTSVAAVGQLQTAFAIACGIGGPVLARLLAKPDRKLLLLIVLGVLTAMNIGSALAPDLASIASLRIGAGFFAALTIPLASTLAVSLVSEEERPKAIATVLAGYTLAFLIGMPVGSLLGNSFGWRAAFWFAAGIAGLATLIIALAAPAHVQAPSLGSASFRRALGGDNPRLMGINLLGFTATFITVSYIGPVITLATKLDGAAIGAVQLTTGLGSLLGLPAGAMLAKWPTRPVLTGLTLAMLLVQLLFSADMLLDLGGASLPLLAFAMATGSAALFATSPIIQARIANAAGPAATLAFALSGSMLYFGQGLGAFVGGAVTSTFGLGWTGVAGASAALVSLLVIRGLQRD